jgi:hypothetical protein
MPSSSHIAEPLEQEPSIVESYHTAQVFTQILPLAVWAQSHADCWNVLNSWEAIPAVLD